MNYKCPECGWIGTEAEMWGDYISDDFWSSTICPGCKTWWCLDDYEIIPVKPNFDDGLAQQRKNLLWAIVKRAFRDARRGDAGAIRFCYAIALKPLRLERELNRSGKVV